MKKIIQIVVSQLKYESALIGSIIFVILLTYVISGIIVNNINKNWQSHVADKSEKIYNDFNDQLITHEKNLIDFADKINSNKKLISALNNENIKKSYENYVVEQNNGYNVEIYNSRFELLLFNGRQINPEINELNKSLNGGSFIALKNFSFYTYLLYFTPLNSDSISLNPDKRISPGVIVVSELVDIKPNIQNKLYQDFGISNSIHKKYGVFINLNPDEKNDQQNNESENQFISSSISSITKDTIGSIQIPVPDRLSYIDSVQEKLSMLFSIEFFLLNLIIIIIAFKFIRKRFSRPVYYFSIIISLILSRFFWMNINFPASLFHNTDIKVFTPSYFASPFLFGIASSVGELFISFSIFLIIGYILLKLASDFYKGDIKIPATAQFFLTLFSFAVLFVCIFSYGYLIQTLVYDSDLKYFDKTTILNTENPELIAMQLSIIFITLNLIAIIISCSLVITRYISSLNISSQLIKKNIVIPVFIIILLVNLLLELTVDDKYSDLIKYNIRNLIILTTGIFTYYYSRKILLNRHSSYVDLVNISFVLVLCVTIIPVIMLNKITSQENKYLEVISRKISEPIDDKIVFSILSTLEDMDENYKLVKDIRDKNKYQKLAFDIWSESKISTEKLNSAIIVLDSNKNLISDFNINPTDLNADSILAHAIKNYDFGDVIYDDDTIEIDSESELLEGQDESVLSGANEEILENTEQKYYYGIKHIKDINYDFDTATSNTLGYVIVTAKYDSKNFISQSSLEIFKNFSRDNIENKIISTPVISEYSNGELLSSSDKEISRTFVKSMDLFRENVKDKIDKSTWRFDEYQGELYKSFYILTYASKFGNPAKTEKIFIVSSKVNDFSVFTFYTFKFLIFVILIYLILILIYFSHKLAGYFKNGGVNRRITFGFREKLFVSFLIVSVIPIVILALYTREFVQNKNNEFYTNQISSDLRIIDQYVKSKIQFLDQTKERKDMIINFTSVFGKNFTESHKNFNLFVKNKLVATTNEELYKSDLLDTRISGDAYYNLAILKKDFFIENEILGNYQFIVGYKPLYNNLNNLTGIISSQTLFRQHEINQELTESLVYIFGTYFLTVIFLVFIVNILSYKISNPIIKLLRATEQLSKGNTEIEVKTNSKDEIGELVNSFNKMTRELKRSREELKKAERETAWRDIARQVAHEIKNPLTPMKLAIQHLNHAYINKSPEFNEILYKTNKLITEQIESLTRIATEFSDFAKMPRRNYEKLKLVDIINDIVHLMDSEKLVKMDQKANELDLQVYGDREQLKRAFINIMKNSFQAIEERKYIEKDFTGSLMIETFRDNGKIKVRFRDNGIGMDEDSLSKLFEPYFSTKTKGMGLGLVITKKIIDDMKGNINIKSNINEGTNVELTFN